MPRKGSWSHRIKQTENIWLKGGFRYYNKLRNNYEAVPKTTEDAIPANQKSHRSKADITDERESYDPVHKGPDLP